MSDQANKTHKPTPKRIKEYRDRGDIAVSKDLTSVATMIGGVVGAAFGASAGFSAIGDLMRESAMATDGHATGALAGKALTTFIIATAPAIIGALSGYFLTATIQLGWPPALKKPSFDLSRPFKLDSIGKILSPKAAGGRALKSTAKVSVVLLVMCAAIYGEFVEFMSDPSVEPSKLAGHIGGAILRLSGYAMAALFALAGIDYVIQKRSMAEKMKMSTDELQREHKEQEGDPIIRGHRRRRMKELAGRRIAAEVPDADVIIVNPTHYAVALKYVAGEDGAPRVVAKGRDVIAERIRAIGRAAAVPVLSRPPLTRLLYKTVPEGDEIPPEVYAAVAEVLAFVYGLHDRGTR